jgi:serine/threonine-protein kinase PknG
VSGAGARDDLAPAGAPCRQPGCTGTILDDGYCDTCGARAPIAGAAVGPAAPAAGATAGPGPSAPGWPSPGIVSHGSQSPGVSGPGLSGAAASAPTGSGRSGASRRSGSTRSGGTRARLGAGLVDVPPVPVGDPTAALMTPEQIRAVLGEVPEERRFCVACGRPVGRSSGGRPGRVKGFCGSCRTPFDFVTNEPALLPGDRVAGQYEVVGCLAHGGLGWIYLARDTAVSNRWVVLKGLLHADDPDALAAAMAERQFLARVEHGAIVRIYNFVTHVARRGPTTGRPAGYIVMEYVGGQSLNALLKARRAANGGVPDPLPPATAIAYVLAALPALSYLHRHGMIYNDLKPANVMATGEGVKLIDLGAVTRAEDPDAAIFGTEGFQAPEVAQLGVSIASDVYTVGRTLAVLVLNFDYHEGAYQHALPPPDDEPLFARWESFYRLLLKATAPAPDDRFTSVDELGEQLLGVLREVVSRQEGQPHPAPSQVFGSEQPAAAGETGLRAGSTDRRVLPFLKIDPGDPAATYLVNLPALPPVDQAALLEEALATQQLPDTTESRLRLARARLDAGNPAGVDAALAPVAAADPWEWRVWWLQGLAALERGDGPAAWGWFDRVWTELPGELAPKLAAALAAERAGWTARAADLYDVVSSVDPSVTSAAFGLARCRLALGDVEGAVAAYQRIPAGSSAYQAGQIAAARVLVQGRPAGTAEVVAAGSGTSSASAGGPGHGDATQHLARAAAIVERLTLDAASRAQLAGEVLGAALERVEAGLAPSPDTRLFGHRLEEGDLRRGLERSYRELARLAPSAEERIRLVDRANRVRPLTLL